MSELRLKCGHCGVEVGMKLLTDGESRWFSDYDETVFWCWELRLCPSCEKPNLIERNMELVPATGLPPQGDEYREEKPLRLLYPSDPVVLYYLPEQIRLEYQDALAVKARSLNAFGVCARRTLEQMCDLSSAQGANLYSRLEDLAVRGILPSDLVKAAQGIRQLSNVGAHSTLGHLDARGAEVLQSLLETILEYVYRMPALVEKLKIEIDRTHI